MNLPINLQNTQAITRRHFFGQAGLGFGSIALNHLLASNGYAAKEKGFRIPAKAKSIIYLHMAGSPSQIDLFENKPALTKFHGKDCPQEYLEGKRFAFIKGTPKMMGPVFDYKKRGQSGQWVSDLLPGLSSVIDDVCVIRSMHTEQFNHSPAQLLLQTGNSLLGYPSMGSWVTYGLGSDNENLPGFVVLASGGKTPSAGKSLWGSGFLPTLYQGVQCRTDGGDPILYLSDPKGLSRKARRKTLDAIRDLNEYQHKHVGDPETLTRISQYELAFRMQMAGPEEMDLKKEPDHILKLYGAKPGHVSESESAADPRRLYKGNDPTFANNCLLARRLAERGVRFIQLFHQGWDQHGGLPGGIRNQCKETDQASAALVTDLKQRGLLEDTLVVWGGEFGRTNYSQGKLTADNYGRDHHPRCFSIWMAGGGIRPGMSFGQTDDFGYNIAAHPVSVHDLHATLLRQFGVDHQRLTYKHQGRRFRLTDVFGDPVQEILS